MIMSAMTCSGLSRLVLEAGEAALVPEVGWVLIMAFEVAAAVIKMAAGAEVPKLIVIFLGFVLNSCLGPGSGLGWESLFGFPIPGLGGPVEIV
ncbi:hypothetical protein RchiOBHm_Chr4g0400881 [Rosa chinensis]|uniref:Uncharacterized protein n=1 Tax=Rosa chinensis TaxID=74649 RepID=A0A2P6QSY2_ROSCH|nr:hypothetical protein RchiOBHm_Chr4g0400881 [Rosa chinensis]